MEGLNAMSLSSSVLMMILSIDVDLLDGRYWKYCSIVVESFSLVGYRLLAC
jgi:hypothetical protein